MKLTAVESSHVNAVGFVPEVEVLLVLFTDGTLAARTGVTVDRYLALLESASKGSFLAAMAEQYVCIKKGNGSARLVGAVAKPGALAPSAPITVNEMLKVKGGEPATGCEFAVVGR